MASTAKQQQNTTDLRIVQLHAIALSECGKLEKLIDELTALGPHSLDRDNALMNTKERLAQLARR